MCGINGILGNNEKAIKAMNQATAHRGPDQTNIALFPQCTLGHNRLSIVDLTETGAQPMTTQNGRYTIVYNGEVYNAATLRNELEHLGVTFRGGSDTEVILYAYEKWGPSCVDLFRGMWAFAIYDRDNKTLFLSRDHFGIKPLYLYRDEKTIALSSEIRGLLALPEINKTIDHEAVRDLVFLGYIVAPKTILKNARSLLPGESILINVIDTTEKSYISRLEAPTKEPPTDDELKTTLFDSVKHHLIADVPVGLFFSGGIDSSVLALTLKELGVHLTAFHVEVPGKKDIEFARKITEHCGIKLNTFTLSETHANTLLEEALAHMDEPLGDSSLMPTYTVSKLAKEEVKVVLSGEGGDELFGGYPRAKRLAGLSADIQSGRTGKTLDALIRLGFPLSPAHFPLRIARGITRRIKTIRGDALGLFLTETATSAGLVQDASIKERIRGRIKERETPDRGLAFDRLIALPDKLLLKIDTTTMAHGIEGRVPLLDRKLFRLVGGAPATWKREGKTGKIPLRRFLKTTLKENLIERKKEGFSVPISQLLAEHQTEKLLSALEWYKKTFPGLIPTIDIGIHKTQTRNGLKEMLPILGHSYYAIFVLADFFERYKLTV